MWYRGRIGKISWSDLVRNYIRSRRREISYIQQKQEEYLDWSYLA
jgi:hypothetical protein